VQPNEEQKQEQDKAAVSRKKLPKHRARKICAVVHRECMPEITWL